MRQRADSGPSRSRPLSSALFGSLHLAQVPRNLGVPPSISVHSIPTAPFSDVARADERSILAIDRASDRGWAYGTRVATPTCQPLAPGLPGYRRYCPYTLHPRVDGAWSAPDLARARRLVGASGTRGERVNVWGVSDPNFVPREAPSYIAAVLRSLGYRAHLHLAPSATITIAMRRRHQLSVDGDWLADYPSASSYIPQFFSCGGGNGNGYYCDPPLDRKMQRASQLEPTHPVRSAAL